VTFLLRKVQSVQNAAARLLTNTRRRDHITPVLRQLYYWLSVYRDKWSSRLHVWHTNRLRQQHRRTYLPTFNLSLSMVVVISAHYCYRTLAMPRIRTTLSDTDYRTACVEQFTGYYKTDHQL